MKTNCGIKAGIDADRYWKEIKLPSGREVRNLKLQVEKTNMF